MSMCVAAAVYSKVVTVSIISTRPTCGNDQICLNCAIQLPVHRLNNIRVSDIVEESPDAPLGEMFVAP